LSRRATAFENQKIKGQFVPSLHHPMIQNASWAIIETTWSFAKQGKQLDLQRSSITAAMYIQAKIIAANI